VERKSKKKVRNSPRIKKRPATKAGRQEAFLLAFSKTGIINDACRCTKIERTIVAKWREDLVFEGRFQKALKISTELMEREALRRATTGTLKPVFYQGAKCGRIREHSDTLLMFILKKRDPSYRDKSFEITGKDGKPLQIEATLTIEQMIEKMRPDEVEAELARMEAEEKASRKEAQRE